MTEVVLPRRGIFSVERYGQETVVDSLSALVLKAGGSYRVSHPVPGGDRCTVFVLRDPEASEEASYGKCTYGVIPPSLQLASHVLVGAAARNDSDAFEIEEAATCVVLSILDVMSGTSGSTPCGTRQLRRVADVKTVLAAEPAQRWTLSSLGKRTHTSPFHLARVFRAVTGESVSRYLTRLRLAHALDRLAAGESNLTRMALDVGFASHSHFSARFRATFGLTPREVRSHLTRSVEAEYRTILTAEPVAERLR